MILGAIIAGGRASRFGSDKALAPWHGRPLIAWAHHALVPFCGAVVVCGREWNGLVALPDLPAPGLGPLGGIAAALAHATAHGFASVLTIGCDMPDVPATLLAALAEHAPACCPDAPILGHWPTAAGPELLARLDLAAPMPSGAAAMSVVPSASGPGRRRGDGTGRALSVRRWAEHIGARPFPAPGLRNINTPADLVA